MAIDTKDDNILQFVEFLAKLGEAEFRSKLESMKLPIRNIFTDLFTENYLEKADKIMSDFVKKELTLKDKEIFFIEYRNLMSKMEIIIS